MPIWIKLNTQNRNSPLIEHLVFFHDHTLIILTIVTTLTIISLTISSLNPFNRYFLEAQNIELFWTIVPALILMFIAIPSLKTLYLIEESLIPLITIKITGYQWFWSYEYLSIKIFKFNSTINQSSPVRLISTSSNLIIPNLAPTRALVSSKDVIHSWAIPSLGVKVDAIPGRINQIFLLIKRPSIIIGQCSEICGAGHRFIPIVLERPSIKNFINQL